MANILRLVKDGLMNAVTGLGTSADARRGAAYRYCPLTEHQIDAAYRGSGMMRKCIDIPALDSVRAWRDWKAADLDIEAIERDERRLSLRQRIYEAEILRGLGGGALILGAPGDPDKPIGDIGLKGLKFINAVSRWQLTLGDMDVDTNSENYGKPSWFMVQIDGKQIRLHPSRVVCFTAELIPAISTVDWRDRFWGESRVARLLNAVKNSDSAQDNFASLLHKAKLTRVGIPGLMEIVGDPEGEALVGKRLAAMMVGESVHNATLFDAGDGTENGGEKITDYQINFSGFADVMNAFDMRVACVADIPATRLLGKAAEGMNSSGDGQQQDWHKHVRAMQDLRLRPCLDHIDRYLIPSATGAGVDSAGDVSIWYEFAALDVPAEAAEATRFKTLVEAAAKAQETGAIPEAAFNEGFQSMLVDHGFMPALESALEKIPETERYSFEAPEPDAGDLIDPNTLTQEPEGDAGAQ
jgi:uncharacterized protein